MLCLAHPALGLRWPACPKIPLPAQNPFRPASDPSVLKVSRATPAETAPSSSVGMPAPKRPAAADGAAAAPGDEIAARETAGEFTAAAARARQPDHQAYDQAEHKAGLAGQGAKVRVPPRCRLVLLFRQIPAMALHAAFPCAQAEQELLHAPAFSTS